MAITDIREIRLLPPLAIARMGSSTEPMQNYNVVLPPGNDPTGFRRLEAAETLVVANNRITGVTNAEPKFRDAGGRIKPVCPFIEVWALIDDNTELEPLTKEHLSDLQLLPGDIGWSVTVSNHKVFRRTGDENDKISATIGPINSHQSVKLNGVCNNFKHDKFIPFGSFQYLEPTDDFPEIRCRFTPAAGLVYGVQANDPNITDDVYDASGNWDNHADFPVSPNQPIPTVPGGTYYGRLNAQTGQWISRGYLDDACDGIVEVSFEFNVGGNPKQLSAFARIASGPPDFAPDSMHLRAVSDEIEQMVLGPTQNGSVDVSEVADTIRRGLETVRLMNTRVMNGNQNVGGVSQNSNNMAGHDGGSGRAFEPIFNAAISDPGFIRQFHEGVLAGAMAGNISGIRNRMRRFDEVGDLSNAGRQKMPGMMRGSDGRHLTVTRRQIDKIRAAEAGEIVEVATPEENMLALIEHFQSRSILHGGIAAGGGQTLANLFGQPAQLLDYLKTENAKGVLAGNQLGNKLVEAGTPNDSAFVKILENPGHPMNSQFAQVIPGTGKTGIEIVRAWIESLA